MTLNVFNSLRIAIKLPMIVVGLCLAITVILSVISYQNAKMILLDEAKKKFEVLIDERRLALTTWEQLQRDTILGLASDPTVQSSITRFDSTFALLTDDPVQTRQAEYITNNPFPTGEKDKLDAGTDSVPYNFQHAELHPFFRRLKDSVGYYDVFLFNPRGDLIYSVFKEPDYATNFVEGPFANSGLGEVFRAARDDSEGRIHFSDFQPYAPSNNQPAAFVATPVYDPSGRVLGVLAVQISADQITEIVSRDIRIGETADLYLVGADNRARSESRFDERFGLLDDLPALAHLSDVNAPETAFYPNVLNIAGRPSIAKVLPVTVLGASWRFVGEQEVAEVMQNAVHLRDTMTLIGLVTLALGSGIAIITSLNISRPIVALANGMEAVAEKNYTTELTNTERADEIGILARNLANLRERLEASDEAEAQRQRQQHDQARVVREMGEALQFLADGDLTRKVENPFEADYEALRTDFNRTVENLRRLIGSVIANVDEIKLRSDRISSSSDELTHRTENQAATLEETAAALDQLTASVAASSKNAREIETIVQNTRKQASASEPVVQNAVAAMNEIEKSSDAISQIIGVIDDIAFQTNLLALNAGVEAARAGDAGRGFAVVASEVRALAQRSSDAAKEIKGLISGSAQQVRRGVNLVAEAGDALTNIVSQIAHISTLMTEIAASSEAQSTGLTELNLGVSQLDKVTQQNSAMVEESTASSRALKKQASTLASVTSQFKLPEQAAAAPLKRDEKPQQAAKPAANEPVFRRQKPEQPAAAKRATMIPLATGTDDAGIWRDF